MPRYVILYHEMPPEQSRASHYDLMLESGKLLRTWAVSDPPNSSGDLAAELLNDHRQEFLDYEGEILGGRGSVTRWDEGEYQTKQESADSMAFVMNGSLLKGELKLRRDASNSSRWQMHFEPTK
jgi:hypothetical protein